MFWEIMIRILAKNKTKQILNIVNIFSYVNATNNKSTDLKYVLITTNSIWNSNNFLRILI